MSTSTEQDTSVRSFRRVIGEVGAAVRSRPGRPLRQRLRLPLMLAGPLVVLIAATWWYLTSGRYVSTDDAYVQAARTMISTDVAGRVVAVEIGDNQRVTKGQVLFRLDDRPFRIAIEEAKAMLAAARLQIEAMKATYRQKLAELRAAQDTLTYQQREFERQRQLAASGVAARATYDQVQNAQQQAEHKVTSTQSDANNILAQLGGDANIATDQHPTVQRAQAALDKAELDLSYATPVFSMMSDRIWVEANFKETELTYMRQGQEATVEIDTYPDAQCRGKLVSLSPGTGLTFSLLPPENATGNWVKVVQRLPVRLSLECTPSDLPLHAGLSATVEIDTNHRRPWLAWVQRTADRLFGTAQAGETRH